MQRGPNISMPLWKNGVWSFVQKSSTTQVAIWRLTKQEEENMQLESSAFEQYFRDVTWNMTTLRKLRKYAREFSTKLQKKLQIWGNSERQNMLLQNGEYVVWKFPARDVENRQNSKYDALEGKLEICYSKEWDKYHIRALRQNCRCSQISH